MALKYLSPLHKSTRQISIYLEVRMAGYDITTGEGHLLSFLKSYEPCPVADLIRVFGLKKSTMTGMLDRLVDKGLMTRDVNEQDRRSFLVGLTAAGRELAGLVNGHVQELERKITARIRDRDLLGFQAVMQAIADATSVQVRPAASKPDRRKK